MPLGAPSQGFQMQSNQAKRNAAQRAADLGTGLGAGSYVRLATCYFRCLWRSDEACRDACSACSTAHFALSRSALQPVFAHPLRLVR